MAWYIKNLHQSLIAVQLANQCNWPGLDDGPAAIEHRRCIDDEADAEALRVVMTEQPDEVLDKLIVHVGRAEVLKVEHYTQTVDDVLVTFLTRQLLHTVNQLQQLHHAFSAWHSLVTGHHNGLPDYKTPLHQLLLQKFHLQKAAS